jgi:UDP-N-acetylglucosamine acyltransferase
MTAGDGPLIHPTAVVDAGAEVGAGVRIGPYAVVGPLVRLGDGVELGAHVVLEGRVVVGARTRIGHGAVIGGRPQDLKYRDTTVSGVTIGEDTEIRELSTVHRATREHHDTRIGRGCLLMAASHVGHDCVVGDHVIVINAAQLAGHVTVEERVTIGALVGIVPFVRVGAFAYVGGCSGLNQDVPPFMIARNYPARAYGVNVVGMRRAGIEASDRRQVQNAFRILYRAGLPPAGGLARLRAEMAGHPLVDRLIDFIAASQIGIIKPGARSAEEDAA